MNFPGSRSLSAPLSVLTLSLLLTANSCAQTPSVSIPAAPIHVLLITGKNNHDWQWTAPSLRSMLEASGIFAVTVTDKPSETLSDSKALAKYRAFVLNYNGLRWGEVAEANFLAAVNAGVGVTVIHAANNSFPGWAEYEKLVALCWKGGTTGHGRFHAFAVKVTDRGHPLTKDMPDIRTHPDELYHRLVNVQGVDFRVLATAHSSKESGGTGQDEPMILVLSYGKGRIFHTPLGHVWRKSVQSRASHADPQFRHLVARGTEWAATGQVTLPAQPPNFLTLEEKKQGFRMLFNGRNLKGWRGYRKQGPPKTGWVAKQGCLVLEPRGGGGDIMTEEQYADFELRFEWKVAPRSNSGVIYHVRESKNATYRTGPEYQILDDAGHKSKGVHSAASLYDMVAPIAGKKLAPTGSFNTGRIVIRKGRLEHWVNGLKVVDCPIVGDEWDDMVQESKFSKMPEFGKYPSGHIAFQDHGDEVWYRSIRIRTFED